MPKFEKHLPMLNGEIDWNRIRWGLEKCETKGCFNDADAIWNGTWLHCIDCIEILLERIQIREQGLPVIQTEIGLWYEPEPYRP